MTKKKRRNLLAEKMLKAKPEDLPQDKPVYGKQYALTGAPGEKCIMNGNTWKESEVNIDPEKLRQARIKEAARESRKIRWQKIKEKILAWLSKNIS